MRQRRLATVAAGITAAFALVAAPAHAGDVPSIVPDHFGEGAVTGTLTCTDGVASITIDSPVFVYDGELGTLRATGTVPCGGYGRDTDAGFFGSFDISGAGVTCTDLGGSFLYMGPQLQILTAGDCTLADGSTERMQLFVMAAYAYDAGGTFAGQGMFNSIP